MHEKALSALISQVSELVEAYKHLGPLEELQAKVARTAEIAELSDVSALVQNARVQREHIDQLIDRPNPTYDRLVMDIYTILENLDAEERRGARELFSDDERTALWPYYWRTHWLAIEEASVERALSGLCIYAFREDVVRDYRDVMCELAPAHACMRQLAADQRDLFARAETFASPSLIKILRGFGARADVTPGSFGWKIVATPYGLRYRQSI